MWCRFLLSFGLARFARPSLGEVLTRTLWPENPGRFAPESSSRPAYANTNTFATPPVPNFRLLTQAWDFPPAALWGKMDSNHRRRTSADLQSAPFGHSGIPPLLKNFAPVGTEFASLFRVAPPDWLALLAHPRVGWLSTFLKITIRCADLRFEPLKIGSKHKDV